MKYHKNPPVLTITEDDANSSQTKSRIEGKMHYLQQRHKERRLWRS
jgi:hypothetical protein